MRLQLWVWVVLVMLQIGHAPVMAHPPGATATASATPSPTAGSDTYWVHLRSRRLFSLGPLAHRSAAERTDEANSRLEDLFEKGLDRIQLEVTAEGIRLNSGNITVVTVTALDSQREGQPLEALAEVWRRDLENSLREKPHSPWLYCGAILLGAIALHLIILGVMRSWLKRSPWLSWCLLWLTASVLLLDEFELSRGLSNFLLDALLSPMAFGLLAWWVSRIFLWVARKALGSYVNDLERAYLLRPVQEPRWRQRMQMKHQVGEVLLRVLSGVSAVLLWARLLQLNLATVLAGAGFFGLGLSLAAKDLLADWFAGINIVIEDQYGVGDQITVNGLFGQIEGHVEAFSLRATQLRGLQGNLVTIPNAGIRAASNLSATSAVATLMVALPISRCLQEAIPLVEELAAGLIRDYPDWCHSDHRVDGHGEVSAEKANQLLIQIPTLPEYRLAIQRELAARVDQLLRTSLKAESGSSAT
ncbi:mechanosensitive ion channel [bacterium]|nr:mechanosensitive ion channel [bacterium]